MLGAPFYVMEKVAGRPYRFIADIAPLGPERTRAISAVVGGYLGGAASRQPPRGWARGTSAGPRASWLVR